MKVKLKANDFVMRKCKDCSSLLFYIVFLEENN